MNLSWPFLRLKIGYYSTMTAYPGVVGKTLMSAHPLSPTSLNT